jgi:hypothetical protein
VTPRRTRPDGGFYPSEIMTGDIDLAELPGRLKSPISFYRSGRVILADDFDIQTFYTPPLGSLLIAQIGSYSPGNHLQLQPAAGSPFLVTAEKHIPTLPVIDKLGVEILVCPVASRSAGYRAYIQLQYQYASVGWTSGVRIDYNTGNIDILTDAGYITVISFGSSLANSLYQWLSIKFIIDTLALTYSALFINSVEYFISNSLQIGVGLGNHFTLRLQAEDTSAAQKKVGFDCLFITRGEP